MDYVIALSGDIVPIEIKSGASGSMKSLHQFMGEKQAQLAVRYDASLPSMSTAEAKINSGKQQKRVSYSLCSLPLYLVERLPEILESECLAFTHDRALQSRIE